MIIVIKAQSPCTDITINNTANGMLSGQSLDLTATAIHSNNSGCNAPGFTTTIHLSLNDTLDPNEDYKVYEVQKTDSLALGDAFDIGVSSLNLADKEVPAGNYYIIVKVDSENEVDEILSGGEVNNLRSYGPFNYTGSANVGIENVNSGSINVSLFPNPVQDQLSILFDSDNNNRTLLLRDMVGKIVLTHRIISSSNTLNVSEIPKGIYFIEVLEEEKRVWSKKIVKL